MFWTSLGIILLQYAAHISLCNWRLLRFDHGLIGSALHRTTLDDVLARCLDPEAARYTVLKVIQRSHDFAAATAPPPPQLLARAHFASLETTRRVCVAIICHCHFLVCVRARVFNGSTASHKRRVSLPSRWRYQCTHEGEMSHAPWRVKSARATLPFSPTCLTLAYHGWSGPLPSSCPWPETPIINKNGS